MEKERVFGAGSGSSDGSVPPGHEQHGTRQHRCGQSKNARNHPFRRRRLLLLRGTRMVVAVGRIHRHRQRNDDIRVLRGTIIIDGYLYY